MVNELVEILKKKNMTIATAESCTGGKIADKIISVSGASRVYGYGFVTYSNEAKEKVIGVSGEIIKKYGVISKETAKEMALGARNRATASIGVSTTGVAGPSEDEGKPVGLVYIGFSDGEKTNAIECYFTGDREAIRNAAAKRAIEYAIEMIRGMDCED